MTRRTLWVCALGLMLAAPGAARAGEVRLAIADGRVSLVARDATLREILLEWERVGGTRIVNRDRVPGTRLTLELNGVTESDALTTLLRPIAGYMASRRVGPEGGASAFSRIVLMTATATPAPYASTAPAQSGSPAAMGSQPGMGGGAAGRPGMQRRVLPDGRVVTVMDDPDRTGEPDDRDEATPAQNPPSMMRPPSNAPPRQAGSDEPQQDTPPGQVTPTTSVAPVAPSVTISTPGALPVTRPGTPPPPIKPPGD